MAYVHIFQQMHLSPFFLKLPGHRFYSAEPFKLSQRWLIKMDEVTISCSIISRLLPWAGYQFAHQEWANKKKYYWETCTTQRPSFVSACILFIYLFFINCTCSNLYGSWLEDVCIMDYHPAPPAHWLLSWITMWLLSHYGYCHGPLSRYAPNTLMTYRTHKHCCGTIPRNKHPVKSGTAAVRTVKNQPISHDFILLLLKLNT